MRQMGQSLVGGADTHHNEMNDCDRGITEGAEGPRSPQVTTPI